MSHFEISRAVTIQADPARVHALVDDFHEWTAWSPWEDLDPGHAAHLLRTRRGRRRPLRVVAATARPVRAAWRSPRRRPRRSGSGWPSSSRSRPPTTSGSPSSRPGTATEVTWGMNGEQTGLAALFARFVPMDKLVGKDFEKGLARLKAVAEA